MLVYQYKKQFQISSTKSTKQRKFVGVCGTHALSPEEVSIFMAENFWSLMVSSGPKIPQHLEIFKNWSKVLFLSTASTFQIYFSTGSLPKARICVNARYYLSNRRSNLKQ